MDNYSVRDFILYWNNTLPLDYWYRKKHNIGFNSPEHRALSVITIKAEWEEEKFNIELYNEEVLERQTQDYREGKIEWLNNKVDQNWANSINWDQFLEDEE